MGPIVLAKNFTFVLADSDIFRGDWIPVDGEFENWNVNYFIQSLSPVAPSNGLTIRVETSYDLVVPTAFADGSAAATGTSNITPSTKMLGYVRLYLANGDTATLHGTVSIWLQPKSD